MNKNQPIVLGQSQIMKCIVCHSEMVGFEILPLCIRCHKCVITYHKVNDIFTIKKYVEQNHVVLLERYVKEVHVHLRNLFD